MYTTRDDLILEAFKLIGVSFEAIGWLKGICPRRKKRF